MGICYRPSLFLSLFRLLVLYSPSFTRKKNECGDGDNFTTGIGRCGGNTGGGRIFALTPVGFCFHDSPSASMLLPMLLHCASP